MATANQLRALARKVGRGDMSGLRTLMEQIAARAEEKGQARLSEDIHSILAASQRQQEAGLKLHKGTITHVEDERGWVTEVDVQKYSRKSIIFTKGQAKTFEQILAEQRRAKELYHHNLEPTRRWLLCGPPGTGKSLTATVLAAELHLPLFRVNVHTLVSRYLGETAQNIAKVFDEIELRIGVYLFDEFDSIARSRYGGQDSGEMDRVVNAVLQLIENDTSRSLLLATSNAPGSIDNAFARRFDEVSYYPLPTAKEIEQLINLYLPRVRTRGTEQVAQLFVGLAHADIAAILRRIHKDILLNELSLERSLIEQHITYYRESKEIIGKWNTSGS